MPFCPESKLSGVGYTDFIPAMWYHRKLAIPSEWAGKRIRLNFGGSLAGVLGGLRKRGKTLGFSDAALGFSDAALGFSDAALGFSVARN